MSSLAWLRQYTAARVAQNRAGDSVDTRETLEFRLAHARARDAVHAELNAASLPGELRRRGLAFQLSRSQARSREEYLRRPDLGRVLAPESRQRLGEAGPCDAVFVLADGLSALAVERHALPLLDATLPGLQDWTLAPVVAVIGGRVAIGDQVGETLRASLAVVLIGERPGMSAPDSLGVYLTWNPVQGRTDAERNCISNIRDGGLSYAAAAHKLLFLMKEARRRKLSGVALKEEAAPLPPQLR